MRILVVLLACITACNQSSPPPPPNVPQPVVISPPAGVEDEVFIDTDSSQLTSEEIVGMWGLQPNCGLPIVFVADGTFSDGQQGQWSLDGDFLTLTQGGRSTVSEVNQLNNDHFTSGPPEDGSGRIRTFVLYRRC